MENQSIRDKLINITFEEIYEKGYQAANTSAILKKANINKGSMYHYFKSKKDLALCVINEKLKQRIIDKYEPLTLAKQNSFNLLIELLNNTNMINVKQGCPVNNLIQEMSPLDDDFKTALETIYLYMEGSIKKALDTAIENKEIISTYETKKLSMFILSAMEGSMITAKKSNSIENYKDAIYILINFLENLKIK